jgi:hypothetical protein
MDNEDFLKDYILGLAQAIEDSRPRVGEIWRLKTEDPDVQLLLNLKQWHLPQFLKIEEVLPETWTRSSPLVRGRSKDGRRIETDSFQFMYELHRPSVWERLDEDQP